MDRDSVRHVIRAAAAITGCKSLVVVGSQAALFHGRTLPLGMLLSRELDLYVPGSPELTELIDGSIGVESPFWEAFGYAADGVGPETAHLPPDWLTRALRIEVEGVDVIVPDLDDLALSKLAAGRPKDLAWIEAARQAALLSTEAMRARLDSLGLDERALVTARRRLADLK